MGNKSRIDYQEMIKNYKEHPRHGDGLWDEAYSIYELLESEYYLSNYNSLRKLEKDIGISKSKLGSYKQAVEFDKKYHFEKSLYSVNTVYFLSRLGALYPDFADYAEKNNIDYGHATTAELKEIIDRFKEQYYKSDSKAFTVKTTLETIVFYFVDIEKARRLFFNHLGYTSGNVYTSDTMLIYALQIDGLPQIQLIESKEASIQNTPAIRLTIQVHCSKWKEFLKKLKDDGYEFYSYRKTAVILTIENISIILIHDDKY